MGKRADRSSTTVTAQISDTFRYRKDEYELAGISEGELFEPSLLGLEPAGTCSACWRGYQAVFGLSGSRLILDELHVNLLADPRGERRQEGPELNGVKPTGPVSEHDWFNNHYEHLAYHLEYTGGLLLADGFIDELYVHMGFHPAWKYERVFELIFDAGTLKREFDRSEQMAEIRARVGDSSEAGDPGRMPSRAEIARFVEQAFDRKYDL
jgi:hypothetical protein